MPTRDQLGPALTASPALLSAERTDVTHACWRPYTVSPGQTMGDGSPSTHGRCIFLRFDGRADDPRMSQKRLSLVWKAATWWRPASSGPVWVLTVAKVQASTTRQESRSHHHTRNSALRPEVHSISQQNSTISIEKSATGNERAVIRLTRK